ncbi:cellulase family glycosylhydrolase [Archangium violaceum]|uniref:cellulase family glycosylhydrolase n=1 Tax=Archangium violaceum TaxID=83451 RepID=UPI00193B9743|nr:cellulase family glycosylhydrolase [Archangium violaceum]QRK09649.1 cellulase family glycosylhydrolase [Archangium violaceum]
MIAAAVAMVALALPAHAATYSVSGNQLLKDGVPYEPRGVNKMSVWGFNAAETTPWGVEILREHIDMKLTSLTQMRDIVVDARANGKVVILSATWYDNDALPGGKTPYPANQLLGVVPSADPRWEPVKNRWREIANYFKGQSDVWFDVWNEPYNWDVTKPEGYTEELWLSEMSTLVDNIRSTGANNIILVPGALMGQGEKVLLNKGGALLSGRSNILFGVHCYSGQWWQDQANIETRFQNLLNKGIPFIVSEYGAGHPFANILGAARAKRIGSLAWLWKHDNDDKEALLKEDGTPNDTNNYTLGSSVKNFGLGARNGGAQQVQNGGFDQGETSWGVMGSNSYSVASNGVLQLGNVILGGGRGQNVISPKPNTLYTLRARGKVGTAGEVMQVLVKGNNYSHTLEFKSASWEEKVLTFLSPADVTWMQINLTKGPGSPGYVDYVSLVR